MATRTTQEPNDWSFKDIDTTMSCDDSKDWDQFKSINALKPTNGRTNQRKRSYIPQHLRGTVLECTPYSSPYTPVDKECPNTAVKKKRQSINDRTYSTGINTTLFEDNSIHRSFRSSTTETNESLSDLQMETEFQSNSEVEEEVVPKLPDLPSDVERLEINGLEFISRDQLKQLNQKVFVLIDLKSEEELKSEHKSDTQSLRRSKRTRMQVMEDWRGQRPIYKRDSSGITLKVVGIDDGFHEEKVKPKKKTNKRKFENMCQKNVNVFDLSIHNKEIKISDNKDSNIKSLESLNWNPSAKSEGVDIAFITKNKQKGEAVGLIRIQGLGVKTKSKTGNYVCHLMVMFGVLAITFKDNNVVKIKTGDNFTIDSNTSYSLSNLRKDVSYINFTIFKK